MIDRRQYAEFPRGWRVLTSASVAVAVCATVMPFNLFGALIAPLGADNGWSRSEIQFGYLLFTLVGGLTMPIAGALVDRIGARTVALWGLPAFAVGLAAVTAVGDSLAVFYSMWAVAGLIGGAATPITFTRLVNDWFLLKRGLALSLCMVVTGLMTAVQQYGSTMLAESLGWRAMLLCFALMPILLAWPLVALWYRAPSAARSDLKEGGRPPVSGVPFGRAIRDRRLWLLAGAIALVTFGIGGTMLNLKPLLSDAGISAPTIAAIAAAVGVSVLVGRIGLGLLLDRYWAPGLACPLFALPAVACVLLTQPDVTAHSALVAGLLIGLAAGGEADLIPYLVTRYFGLVNYGQIFGVMFACFIVASGVAPFVFGLVFDRTGSYVSVLYVAAVFFSLAAMLVLALGAYPDPPGATQLQTK